MGDDRLSTVREYPAFDKRLSAGLWGCLFVIPQTQQYSLS